jgi:nuclear GTP-binding protein
MTFTLAHISFADFKVSALKKQRMTTNKKRIGVHYYESANVKNKNRVKTAKSREGERMDPKRLEKKFKGDGKRRNR